MTPLEQHTVFQADESLRQAMCESNLAEKHRWLEATGQHLAKLVEIARGPYYVGHDDGSDFPHIISGPFETKPELLLERGQYHCVKQKGLFKVLPAAPGNPAP